MGAFFVYNNKYAGKCFWTQKRSRITSIFTYDDEYLSESNNWNIDPELLLASGAQPPKNGLPGAFRDAAPDRWGQILVRHRILRDRKNKGKQAGSINEVDYLLGTSDISRQGDLRFALEKDGDFQYPADEIPKLIALPKLMNAAHRVISDNDESAVEYLLDAGSASLGGARPKAAVYDGDCLYIAKFPHRQDEWDVIAWEWISLQIAKDAGVRVPHNKLVRLDDQNVLLTKRFDRDGKKRIGYISAMTLLGLTDGEQADYSEIAEKLRELSVSPREDLHELFRRIILSLYINNTDDHLRNHGFIRSGCGWRLSPVFDINPNPDAKASRVTSVFGETHKTPALTALLSNLQTFDLTDNKAEKLTSTVASAVKNAEEHIKKTGITKAERTMLLKILYHCG